MAVVFHKFPELLPELRIQIWMQAFLEPRIVEITFLEQKMFRDALPLLSACYESRQITLPHYKNSIMGFQGHQTFFNHERDILYFPDKHCEERRSPSMRDSRGSGRLYDFDWDIMTFYLYCKTATKVRHLAFPIMPPEGTLVSPYWSNWNQFGHERACRAAMDWYKFQNGHNSEWYPSITLISKDSVVEASGDKYLEYGPVKELKGAAKLKDSTRQLCHCLSWYDQLLFSPNAELQKLGIPIPDRSMRQSCRLCRAHFNLDLRVATVERAYVGPPVVSEKSSAFTTLLAEARASGVTAPANSNGNSNEAATSNIVKTRRRKAISRLPRKAVNHLKGTKKTRDTAENQPLCKNKRPGKQAI
ncbi:hypothetical protein BDZ45DRAFT_739260 [Acephala macrosclerotiorum]|nr:hypothetical protein BDZ45DRAFT_739260 [Acephala macrosclerotiorum]